jgi:hypothetical protein
VAARDVLRGLEVLRATGDRGRRVEHDEVVVLDVVPDPRRIIGAGLRQRLFLEPHAAERMPVDKNENRMQPGLLHSGRCEEGQVQAGGLPLFEDLLRQTDPLSFALEAGRWTDVLEFLRLKCRVHRRCLLERGRRVLSLVSVHRRTVPPAPQLLAGSR